MLDLAAQPLAGNVDCRPKGGGNSHRPPFSAPSLSPGALIHTPALSLDSTVFIHFSTQPD